MSATNTSKPQAGAPTLVLPLLMLSGLSQAVAQESSGHSVTWALAGPEISLDDPRDGDGTGAPSLEIRVMHSPVPPPASMQLVPAPAWLAPEPRTSQHLARVDLRLWLSTGRFSFGAGVDRLASPLSFDRGRADAPTTMVGSVPTVGVGVRYQLSEQHWLSADALRTRRLGNHAAAGYVTTNIGFEWKPPRPRFGFERGMVGLQLDSGYRLSLKMRHGKPMLYLRAQF